MAYLSVYLSYFDRQESTLNKEGMPYPLSSLTPSPNLPTYGGTIYARSREEMKGGEQKEGRSAIGIGRGVNTSNYGP